MPLVDADVNHILAAALMKLQGTAKANPPITQEIAIALLGSLCGACITPSHVARDLVNYHMGTIIDEDHENDLISECRCRC